MFDDVVLRLQPFAREFVQHGKQLYLVGGAVRNLLLGRPAKDFDFTTDALPHEVQSYFRKVLPTGIKHGTVTVLFLGQSYEVTTFRVDGKYTDARRPDAVTFTPSLEEDLKRRDFTVNAIALNLGDGSLVDPHDGRGDLKRGVLKAIGEPGERFDEDALRLLRLFRFAAQLGFAIDPPTLEAAASRRASLGAVSRERIREELAKAMAGAFPALAWTPLQTLGVLGDLFPSLTGSPLGPADWEHVAALPDHLRWSVWLTAACSAGLEAWDRDLKALTFSNADRDAYLGPAKALAFLTGPDPVPVAAKAVVEAWGSRDRIAPGLRYLRALEALGLWRDEGGWKRELERIGASGEPVFLEDLALGGKELLAAGVPPGRAVGQTLRTLQRLVWKAPELNSPEGLLANLRPSR
jgi:poly(A) polymerase/tRNA nucleotidyltransferase (CCA-adding enzyme)